MCGAASELPASRRRVRSCICRQLGIRTVSAGNGACARDVMTHLSSRGRGIRSRFNLLSISCQSFDGLGFFGGQEEWMPSSRPFIRCSKRYESVRWVRHLLHADSRSGVLVHPDPDTRSSDRNERPQIAMSHSHVRAIAQFRPVATNPSRRAGLPGTALLHEFCMHGDTACRCPSRAHAAHDAKPQLLGRGCSHAQMPELPALNRCLSTIAQLPIEGYWGGPGSGNTAAEL